MNGRDWPKPSDGEGVRAHGSGHVLDSQGDAKVGVLGVVLRVWFPEASCSETLVQFMPSFAVCRISVCLPGNLLYSCGKNPPFLFALLPGATISQYVGQTFKLPLSSNTAFCQYGRSKKQGLVYSFMEKIEVAAIEDEGGTTHVKQTSTFKYGDRKEGPAISSGEASWIWCSFLF